MIPRPRFRMNVRGHLAVLVLATLLPALVFFAVTLVMFHRQTHAATERGLVDTARALTIAIDRELQATITTLQALAVSEQLQAGDLRAFYATLQAVHRTRQNWSSILLYDQSGQQLINLRHPFGTPLPRSTRAADVQRVAQTRAPMITNLFRGARSGRMLVQVMVPVGAPAPKYVLGASFEPSALSAILLQQKFPADSIIALLDRNKVIIGRSRAPERFIGQPGTPDLQARMDEMAEGAFQAFTKEGQSVRAAISRSSLSGWTIALGIPEGAAAPFLSALGLMIGGGGGFIALGLVLAWLIGRRLARSIGSLGPLAEDLARGRAVQTLQSPVPEVVAVAAAIEAAGLTRSLAEAERLALLDEAERRRRAAEALAEVGRLISRSLDPEVVGQLIVDNIRRLLGATTAQLWRRLNSDDLVMLALSDDSGYLVRSEVWPRGTGVVGLAVERREAAFVDDALADPSVTFPPDVRARIEKRGSQAVLAIPLVNGNQVVGALAITGDVGRTFDREDVRLAQAFADQTVVALENSRLHSDALRRGEELGALLRAARTVMADLDLDGALDRICDEASQMALTPSVSVLLVDPATRVLRAAAVRGTPLPLGHERELGVGYSGRVAETGRPLFVANIQDDPANIFAERDREAGIRTYLGLPIKTRDEVLGVLRFVTTEPRRYGPDEIEYLTAFADQAAVAIANARLFAETERRRRAAESLAAVGRLISESLDPERVGQLAVESLCRLVDARMAVLYRLEPSSGDLVLVAGVGDGVDWNSRLTRGTATVGLAVAERRAVTTSDLLSDPRISLDPEARGRIERSGYRAVLAVPLVADDRVVGAVGVGAPTGRVFGTEDIDLAQAFADRVAVAIANARLFAETERRRRAAESLAAVGRLISESLDPEQVGQLAVESLCRLVDARMAALYRLDPASGDLLFTAGVGVEDSWNRRLASGAGAVGLAVRERRPVTTTDLLSDPRISLAPEARTWIERTRHRAVLAVPLLLHDRVVGALGVGAPQGRTFDADEIHLAEAFADQVALAFQNARLFAVSERRRSEAEALADLGRALVRSLDVAEVGDRITESVRTLLSVSRATLYRLDEPTGDLIAVSKSASDGAALSGRQDRVPPGTAAIGWAVQARASISTTDVLGDPRVSLTPEQRERMAGATNRAVLAVPLICQGRVIGALSLGDAVGRVFTELEERLALAFADQAAIALQNATLVRDLKAREARLGALLEVSSQLSAIQPLDSLLTKIAEGCGTLLGSDSVGLRIVEGDELVIAGTRGDAAQAMPTKRLKIGESLSGLVAKTGEPLSIRNMLDDPRLLPAHRPAVAALGYSGWLGVPVKVGERVLGVLSIRTREQRGFTEEDTATAMAFAAQAAVALENARLYGEIRQAYEELQRTQDQLTQAQKMEAIGRLAGGVAHDFNNLLTVIAGRAAMLRSRLGADGDGSRHAVLIQETAARAARLTRQLLAFSRKQDLKPKVLDLNALVAPTSLMLRRLIGEDIDFITRLGSGLWNVKADPGQLEQVLMNLTVNARDAMPNGGRLTLETANVEVGEPEAGRVGLAPGAYVMLALSDTGVGMPPEVQAQIFEPFFTTKGPGKGTGLGLATVYGIVTQSDGHITLESVPTQGTTFRIYLPRVEAPIDSAPADGPREAPRGTETILLVEDEPEVRDLIREMLEAHGYTVLSALGGIEALDVAERHPGTIHLLLTDVIMPQMSGRQLAERLAAVRPQTKILYMSGYTDGELGHHGVLDPDIMLAEKPFTPPEIARKVREALDGGRHGRRQRDETGVEPRGRLSVVE